jgi:hypothetical protein
MSRFDGVLYIQQTETGKSVTMLLFYTLQEEKHLSKGNIFFADMLSHEVFQTLHEDGWGNGDTVPSILNLGTRWR